MIINKPKSLRSWFVLIAPLILLSVISYSFVGVHAADIVLEDSKLDIQIVTQGLKFPVGMAFLNSNEILVLEKDEGKVLRVVNGNISDDPVLTLDINHVNERGLLGVAVPRDLQTDRGSEESVPKYVFLFYTEAKGGGNNTCVTSHGDANCERRQEREDNEFSNRLYRYELKNNKLVNPKLLIDIPIYLNNRVYPSVYSQIIYGGSEWRSYPLREGIHNGGALVMDYDNNVYLVTGDGGGCFSLDGCFRSIENGFLASQSANKKGGINPIGMGGVLHVTKDGEPVGNNRILGNGSILKFYYAYGIRNSFGIDFDPLTRKLWNTENGPDYGDEINLVEPGFNSGWAHIQGIWPVVNYLDLRVNASDRGHSSSSILPVYDDMEDFDGKGQYSDPEFTWNGSVGVTSIKFLDTKRLGKQYEDDLLVADAYGRIYHFELNENRSALDLNGPLKDKVANDDFEFQDLIFAQGLDTITDIEVGPDGYVYVLSYSGKIFKIFPKATT